jgi:hypothetical protein
LAIAEPSATSVDNDRVMKRGRPPQPSAGNEADSGLRSAPAPTDVQVIEALRKENSNLQEELRRKDTENLVRDC